MKYVIISVDRLAELGIDSKEFRKSNDGSLAILHEEFIQPVTDTAALERYEHDSVELKELLISPRWKDLNGEPM